MAVVLASALSTVACATSTTATSADAEAAARREAESECVYQALGMGHHGGGVLAPYTVDRDVYARCMEARGYSVTTR